MTSVTDCSQHKFGHTDLHTQICKCTCTYGWPNRLVSGCKLQKKKKKEKYSHDHKPTPNNNNMENNLYWMATSYPSKFTRGIERSYCKYTKTSASNQLHYTLGILRLATVEFRNAT